jgi:hypothetical protein
LRCLGLGLDRTVGGPIAGSDSTQHGSDGDRFVRLDEDLGDGSGKRRRDLGVDLVGGDLYKRIVDVDGVADVDAPLEDCSFGHRVAHFGERDVDGLGSGRRALRRGGRAVSAVRFYLAEHRSHLNSLIGFRKDLYKRPGGRGGDLGIDLVCRDLNERLVGLDPVSNLLQPAEDRALGD